MLRVSTAKNAGISIPQVYLLSSHPEIDHQKEKIWCFGKNITSKLDDSLKECFEISTFQSLDHLMYNSPDCRKKPEAILVHEDDLNSPLVAELVRLKNENENENLSILFFVISETPYSIDKVSKLKYVDGVFSPKAQSNEVQSRIEFLRKVKTYNDMTEESILHLGYSKYFQKRVFDIVISSLALFVLLPVFLFIAILLKLESKGPVFYISKRAGRNYKIFDFYKFRSMHQDAESRLNELSDMNEYNGSGKKIFYKINNDPRVTKIGQFLRDTSLDELPQLINILKGDMSIVGNRPLPLYEAEMLTTDESVQRFLAPAGLTGLWQVKQRGTRDLTSEERIMLDKLYARKCSFLLDIKLIIQTFPVFIQKESF